MILYVNNEVFEAEKIIKTNKDIIGYNGNSEVFAFRGINDFSKFALEKGLEFDTDEKQELTERIESLERELAEQKLVLKQAKITK